MKFITTSSRIEWQAIPQQQKGQSLPVRTNVSVASELNPRPWRHLTTIQWISDGAAQSTSSCVTSRNCRTLIINYDSSLSDIFNLLVSTKFLPMIPMLGKIIQIVGVIPSTSCEAERSFSAHRHLKT